MASIPDMQRRRPGAYRGSVSLQFTRLRSLTCTTDTTMMANPSDEIKVRGRCLAVNLITNKFGAMQSMIPIGRLGKPHEVASVVEVLVTNPYLTNKVGTDTSSL